MTFRLTLLPALLLLVTGFLHAQDTVIVADGTPPPYDSLRLLYPFLNLEENRLAGDTAALRPFFTKLDRIRSGSREQAVVVHIGDSHIQPGGVTRPLREWLQSTAGNAGPGLIFPYRVAKSNGPSGYLSSSTHSWLAARNATPKRKLPTGVSGFSLWSALPGASFRIEFPVPPIPESDTARLLLFQDFADTSFFLRAGLVGDSAGFPVSDSSRPGMTLFKPLPATGSIEITAVKTSENQRSAAFYGMSLESDRPGVIVHTIGVNGATYANYADAEHFARQLALLKPDLLIVSLGTNEAFATRGFKADSVRSSMDSLFIRIERDGYRGPVILTTPPGIYKGYRKKRRTYYKPNPTAHTVAHLIKEYADTHGMAVWDWYTVMGGRDAMAKWKAKKMTDRRHIHFTGKGYAIQGMLMKEAIRSHYQPDRTSPVFKETPPESP